jgi:protein-L-isoaspartate(D-aspartate) O-methyltransferase
LSTRARQRLKELGIRNVRFRHGDGSLGWKAHAPFDGILVAAAPLTVPEALIKQLKVGGRLLVPIGPEGKQELVRFTRREQRVERESLGPVAFVPLLGGTA